MGIQTGFTECLIVHNVIFRRTFEYHYFCVALPQPMGRLPSTLLVLLKLSYFDIQMLCRADGYDNKILINITAR